MQTLFALPRMQELGSVAFALSTLIGCASHERMRVEADSIDLFQLVPQPIHDSGPQVFGPNADAVEQPMEAAAFAAPTVLPAFALQSTPFVPGWCFIGGIGYSCVDSSTDDDPGYDVDEMGVSYNAAVGYRVLRYLSLEAGYTILGEEEYDLNAGLDDGTVNTEGFQICAVGHYPFYSLPAAHITSIEAIARVGAFIWEEEEKRHFTGTADTVDDDGTDLMFGVGFEAVFTQNLSARIEWARYEANSDYDNWLLSVVWML